MTHPTMTMARKVRSLYKCTPMVARENGQGEPAMLWVLYLWRMLAKVRTTASQHLVALDEETRRTKKRDDGDNSDDFCFWLFENSNIGVARRWFFFGAGTHERSCDIAVIKTRTVME